MMLSRDDGSWKQEILWRVWRFVFGAVVLTEK